MEKYVLEEVMSGTEDSCLWVTLGFASKLEDNDVVHLVCAMAVDAQDRNAGMADLYLERFDQAYSCYGGADRVVATPSTVEVHLNRKGCEALDFEGSDVCFQVPDGLQGYHDAVGVLRRMSALECGKTIRVDVPG